MIVQIFMIFMNQEASWSSFDDSIGWELPEKFSFSLTPWKLFIYLFFWLWIIPFCFASCSDELVSLELESIIICWPSGILTKLRHRYTVITSSWRHFLLNEKYFTFDFCKLLFDLSKYFSELHWIASRTCKIDEVEFCSFFWFMTGCTINWHSNYQWTYIRVFCEAPDLKCWSQLRSRLAKWGQVRPNYWTYPFISFCTTIIIQIAFDSFHNFTLTNQIRVQS